MNLEAIRCMKETPEAIHIRMTLPLTGVSTRVDAGIPDDRRKTTTAATFEFYKQSLPGALVEHVLGPDPSLDDLIECASIQGAAEGRYVSATLRFVSLSCNTPLVAPHEVCVCCMRYARMLEQPPRPLATKSA
jgi:hypothetical protein